MKQLYAPNGLKITGTKESVPCVAAISGWDEQGEPVYAGGSDMQWDYQHLVTDENDELIVVDEDGGEWPKSECEAREEPDEGEEDEE
jgi:hypothetical protein